ncbi:MAG: bifunctional riboflavin kinase/FAD synthetase [Pseudomonadota bacterium]
MSEVRAPFALDLGAVPAALKGGTVAIGNFDGVHRGHQAVLSAAIAGPGPTLALTFEPHPRAYFGGKPIFRLTPPEQKGRVCEAFGLDGLVVARFDGGLASLDATAFSQKVLCEALGAKHVAVGHDFKFGKGRSGNAESLTAIGAEKGFGVTVVPPFSGEEGGIVSSSRIRDCLGEGDAAGAAALLGYRYQIASEVVHGKKRGRAMGYPTANQNLAPENGLRQGIYAVRIKIDGVWRDGVASFGRRPTFDNGPPVLETFVFDFDGDLYGQVLPVALYAFLRPELKFDGMDALIAQMDEDSANARAHLATVKPVSPLDAALNF